MFYDFGTRQTADLSALIKFIRQHFKTLALSTCIGAAISFTFTLFIPKEYISSGIVYPPSSPSIDNSVEFPNFGYDLEADRLIQILQSKEIRDSVIQTFDLISHFEIDQKDPAWLDNLNKKYYKSIYFDRGVSMSVVIYCRTKNAELSANIINYIIRKADDFRETLYKKNINIAYQNALEDYELQKRKVDSTEVALTNELKKNNLSSLLMLVYDTQTMIDIEKLNGAELKGSNSKIGPDLIAFKGMHEVLKEYKKRYLTVRKSYLSPIPKLFLVSAAEANYKKVSPSFAINLLIGSALSLFISVMVLFIRGAYATR